MTSMHSQFSTDKKLEQGGVWLDYDIFRVKIARAGGANTKFAKSMEKHSEPHRRAMETRTLSEPLARKMLYTVYAETVILDWTVRSAEPLEETGEYEYRRGIEGADGEMVEFNKENVIKTFTELHDLFSDISDQAVGLSLFRHEDKEADAGN